jgi:general secretion pathway protein K
LSVHPHKSGVSAEAAERGFALLLVIWIMALLAVLAGGMAADTRSAARIMRNRIDTGHARARAEAGVALAVYNLLEPNPALQWPVDGRPRLENYDEGEVTVTVQDENGKVDVNAASAELIAGLFATLAIEDGSALARAIVGYRERVAGQPVGPARAGQIDFLASRPTRNAGGNLHSMPFAAVSELRRLPGMTSRVFERIRPYVTVYSESARINPRTAPPEVLLGLPGVSPQEVGFTLAARAKDGATRSTAEPPILSGVDRYIEASDVHAATITATAVAASGGRYVREAVVVLTGAPLHPFRFAQWRQGIESEDDGR